MKKGLVLESHFFQYFRKRINLHEYLVIVVIFYHFRGMENMRNIVAERERTYEEIGISNIVLRGRKKCLWYCVISILNV